MKVAILTDFTEFRRGYSLTGIALDQAIMLSRNGHQVRLFVSEKYHGIEELPGGVKVERKVPSDHMIDFMSEKELTPEHAQEVENGRGEDHPPDLETAEKIRKLILLRGRMADMLRTELKDTDICFTHDFIFQGWAMPLGLGIRDATPDLPGVRWLHWIHSVPRKNSDWWNINLYGPLHRLVYPNKADSILVVEQYKGWLRNLVVIPHPKDYRSFGQFSEDTWEFCDWTEGNILNADIVQIYPASVDRLEAKRVPEVIDIFYRFKTLGKSVCLIIANQWTTVDHHKATVEKYKHAANLLGLIPGKELFFTSDYGKKFEVGVPLQMIWELFHFANIYISFTREETYGLGIAEAALNGCLLVLNKSLDVLKEITGGNALFFNFGSHEHDVKIDNREKYHTEIAKIIVQRMKDNQAEAGRTWFRKKGNLDHLYKEYYAPVMADSQTWIG